MEGISEGYSVDCFPITINEKNFKEGDDFDDVSWNCTVTTALFNNGNRMNTNISQRITENICNFHINFGTCGELSNDTCSQLNISTPIYACFDNFNVKNVVQDNTHKHRH